jgi:three-Cys-motif partner protein
MGSRKTATDKFFSHQTPASETKSDIIVEYALRWGRIMARLAAGRDEHIRYVDLYAGPGVYDDGAESTPVRFVRAATRERFADRLCCWFNDSDQAYIERLERRIRAIPGADRLRMTFTSEQVGGHIAHEFATHHNMPPTFTFIDPCGYRGLTNRLIQGALRPFGCEVVFFFNYRRINAAIDNSTVEHHVEQLFDEDPLVLRRRLAGLSPAQRNDEVARMLEETLCQRGYAQHVLPFTFFDGDQVSHRIVFATKQDEGAIIMKEVMAAADGCKWLNGMPLYAYQGWTQADLFDVIPDPVEAAANILAQDLAGQTMTVRDAYVRRLLRTRYLQQHSRDALLRLEEAGVVQVDVPRAMRPIQKGKPTLGDDRVVTFSANPFQGVTGLDR